MKNLIFRRKGQDGGRGQGRGQGSGGVSGGRGLGRGRGNKPGSGPDGNCICPHCGYRQAHIAGQRCYGYLLP